MLPTEKPLNSSITLMPKVLELLEPVLQASKVVECDGASVANTIPLTKNLRMELEQWIEWCINSQGSLAWTKKEPSFSIYIGFQQDTELNSFY